ncbi:MAG: hypothetical protein JJ921_19000 [Pseudomonadales bacterium]|nr:hypothetical protein [Pseudomonadales bacterium]MBO7007950.1 hypothetical protein [Pseudomonadales bacterium]
MKAELNTKDWHEEDHEVASENAEIIGLYRAHRNDIVVPDLLDRRIHELASQQNREQVTSQWVLGQGPWVILVTSIVFIVALMVLSII